MKIKKGYSKDMPLYINPMMDVVIKYILGRRESTPLLLDLINAVQLDSGLQAVSSIEVQNPFNLQRYQADKLSIIDIRAVDAQGRHFAIELQVSSQADYRHRSLYYWSRLYSDQLKNGEIYSVLKPVIAISLLDFQLFWDDTQVHHCFMLQDINKPQNCALTDHLVLHFIEKAKAVPESTHPRLRAWIDYFNREGLEDNMEILWKDDELLSEAHKAYRQFTANDEARAIYEARWFGQLDYNSGMHNARQEGINQEKLEAATKLKAAGVATAIIAYATGLETELIEGL